MRIGTKERIALKKMELIETAKVFGLPQINHPDNIAEGIKPKQALTLKQIYRELGEEYNQYKHMVEMKEPLIKEGREIVIKRLRQQMKDNAEGFLDNVFSGAVEIDPEKKARLALDLLKATEKEYNVAQDKGVTINLSELPLGEGLLSAKRALILEMGIDNNILSQIENEQND